MNQIEIYRLNEDKDIFKIVPLELVRDWMSDSRGKHAYKCLPLNIANQYGWAVLSPADFSVSWYGGQSQSDVELVSLDPDFGDSIVISHFGEATVTIQLDFIVKTPENYSTYIRGIPNKMDGIVKPLDAIVETDWLPFTFTYNFRFMDSGVVDFKKGEPLFCFFPIERNSVENFGIHQQNINDFPELNEDFRRLAHYRLSNSGTPEKPVFQRFYAKTEAPFKKFNVKNHIKRLMFGGKPDRIDS